MSLMTDSQYRAVFECLSTSIALLKTSCTPLLFFHLIPKWYDLNNLSIIPFHILESIDLIPNETGFEYHSTSIAIFKTSWIPFHTDISFDSQRISISILTTYQWFLFCFCIRNQLMSMYSLIPNWMEIEIVNQWHSICKDIMSFQINCSSNWGSPLIELRDSNWSDLSVIHVPFLK